MSTRGDPAILQEPAPRGLDDAPAASEPRHREPDGAPEAQRRQSFLLDLNDQMRAIDDPLAIMAQATAMLGACLGASRVGYGEVDAREETITVERDWTGGTLPNAVGSYRLELFGTTVL